MVLEAPFLCSASIAYTKNGITTIRLTREWEFLERRRITKPTTSFNFDTTVRNSDDTDYQMVCYWVATTPGETGPNLFWYINNQTTGLSNEGSSYNFASTTTAGLLLGTNASTDGSHYITSTLLASEGKRFTHTQHVHELGNTTSNVEADFIGSKWNDSTEITSLGAATSQTGSIGTGSWFDLYRRPQFDKTPLTLWVY